MPANSKESKKANEKIRNVIVEELLKDYEKPEDLLGEEEKTDF